MVFQRYKANLYLIDTVCHFKVIKMKAFRVVGTFNDARQEKGKQPFSIEIADVSVEAAKEQALSTLGSRHKLKRWQIQIAEVTDVAEADITNPVVKYKVTGE